MSIAELITVDELAEDCPADVYHAFDAASNSRLGDLKESPESYYAQYVAKTMTPKPRKVFQLGTLSHLAYLEADELDGKCEVIPTDVLASNGARSGNAYKDWCKAQSKPYLLKRAEFDEVRRIADKLLAHTFCRSVIEARGQIEYTTTWRDEETGILCKARFDKLIVDADLIPDLKTSADVRPYKFAKSVADFGYHRQDAIYSHVYELEFGRVPDFIFICINNAAPYEIATHRLSPKAKEIGLREFRELLAELKHRHESGNWLAKWQTDHNDLDLPFNYERYQ